MNQGAVGHGSYQWTWNSSVSFLYGGLAPIFIVIGIALLTVACSRCLRPEMDHLPNTTSDSNKSRGETSNEIDREPNVLVIVAGEKHPTHLALPSSHS
ncbi:protein GLUTAMINE DUMPER 2-like [Vicia villosa]|uniref:protein GLUTAMINE DUMPER 2-like n=1 Tax=Vicia villosa TaxID=3911 RepID=UPI00273B3D87|nr:protein GLUTAMINE DUMPER 2-like [Vicia villosa]